MADLADAIRQAEEALDAPGHDHGCAARALALRSLLAAAREAEADIAEAQRTADDAVKFLGRLAEVTWDAGCPGGDRDQTMRNLVALVARAGEAEADVARLTRQHEGCDAKIRSLVSQGLAAIRRAEKSEAALAEERGAHLTLVQRLEEQRQITRETVERAVEMERQRNHLRAQLAEERRRREEAEGRGIEI